ncbi:hypothetical protein COB64_01920 [Candidatus Wolfebacteria bacterium]|nr:MAG: hypothetical protein COB64_01920 [Candidatus Wolfebacteria bacterium]
MKKVIKLLVVFSGLFLITNGAYAQNVIPEPPEADAKLRPYVIDFKINSLQIVGAPYVTRIAVYEVDENFRKTGGSKFVTVLAGAFLGEMIAYATKTDSGFVHSNVGNQSVRIGINEDLSTMMKYFQEKGTVVILYCTPLDDVVTNFLVERHRLALISGIETKIIEKANVPPDEKARDRHIRLEEKAQLETRLRKLTDPRNKSKELDPVIKALKKIKDEGKYRYTEGFSFMAAAEFETRNEKNSSGSPWLRRAETNSVSTN